MSQSCIRTFETHTQELQDKTFANNDVIFVEEDGRQSRKYQLREKLKIHQPLSDEAYAVEPTVWLPRAEPSAAGLCPSDTHNCVECEYCLSVADRLSHCYMLFLCVTTTLRHEQVSDCHCF